MKVSSLSPSQARLKLVILDKQAKAKNSYEFYSQIKDFKLPNEVVEILRKIQKVTSKIAGKVVAIGKIIVIKLLEYVAEHPLQIAGLAVGLVTTYALGVAIQGLFSLIPALAKWKLIGGLLAKLALLIAKLCQTIFVPLMFAAPIAGVVFGEMSDKKYPEISESLKQVVKDFFNFFSQIINSIKDEFDFSDYSQVFV
ncbi:hypothetical protein Xen7305DRAFT_00033320 [Xenococcus sp. PCC 7305]|uniref:hypothetical protein n=1 Tax=Xenococcus sp. PCC 7305 TaxID=102125 RepID=UPI0002ACC257|nr:hypothetical protein [Xenococcus sp. PCC 7305]ELS03608.1 hypothetical protein Xen7305DRAFT_00033320 [Xenococcus sp. PCC 7305]